MNQHKHILHEDALADSSHGSETSNYDALSSLSSTILIKHTAFDNV